MTKRMVEVQVGPLASIPPGEGRNFLVGTAHIAVFRTRNEEVYAVQAECPHRGGPLAAGLVGSHTVICPLHAWKFELATGKALLGDCGLKTYPVRVDGDGWIVVGVEEAVN